MLTSSPPPPCILLFVFVDFYRFSVCLFKHFNSERKRGRETWYNRTTGTGAEGVERRTIKAHNANPCNLSHKIYISSTEIRDRDRDLDFRRKNWADVGSKSKFRVGC